MNALFKATDPGFYFGDHYIRIVRDFTTDAGTAEDIGFIAKDVASALGIDATKDFTRILADDQKGGRIVPTPGGDQSMTVVSESGFYEGVILSRKPEGKALRGLVTREILPTLRKTGGYQVQPAAAPPLLGRAQEVSAIYLMMAEELKKVGVKPGIAVASAFSSIQQETGISTAGMMKSLPPIDTDAPQLNPSQLGEILGLSAKAVNKRLEAAGLQWWTGKGVWQLTEKGQKYGGAFPYSKNNHTGFQIRWVRDVSKVIKD